ncbi:MAG: helix-turn-helix domain-containing protein [Mycobacterium sp.]|nr:helix-turn-helix domain-containing protein [Mycobacterium sp.]
MLVGDLVLHDGLPGGRTARVTPTAHRAAPGATPGPRRDAPRQALLHALSADLTAQVHAEGANIGTWPGSVIYRFSSPAVPRWPQLAASSICIVLAPDIAAHTAHDHRELLSWSSYVLIDDYTDLNRDLNLATAKQPVLVLQLKLDAQLVGRTLVSRRGSVYVPPEVKRSGDTVVPQLDVDSVDAIVRFVRTWRSTEDRRYLGPLYVQELTYRLAHNGRYGHGHLSRQTSRTPTSPSVAAVVDHIRTHLSEAMSVEELAGLACMSASAFTRAFRSLTGQPPYQFVKRVRMERAEELLSDGDRSVSEVARTVGYTNVSHFIREFRGRYGVTPGTARSVSS